MKKLFIVIKARYGNLPLNLQINLVTGLFLLAVTAFLTANTYINTLNQIKHNFRESSISMLQETTDKINSRLRLVESTSSMIAKDSRILNFANAINNINESEISRYLNNCINLNRYDLHQKGVAYEENLIDDIIFTTSNNIIIARRLHFTAYNIHELLNYNSWFVKARENKGKLIWTELFYNHTYEDFLVGDGVDKKARLNQFMLINYIVDEKSFFDLGYVAISINLESLSKLIDNIEPGSSGNLYIVDGTGRVIAGKNRAQLLENLSFDKKTADRVAGLKNSSSFIEGRIGQSDYFILSSPLYVNGWSLILTVPVRELTNSVSNALLSIIVVGVAAFIIMTAISTLIMSNALHPLKKMIGSINEIRKGNFNNKIEVGGCFEVTRLCLEYNIMLDRINSLLKKIVDEQETLRKSELKAFSSQINPHFLYNTMDSIKWLVASGNSEKASDLISSLSAFFRLGLSGGIEEIPIRDEIEHARQYLFIQKIRCGDRMDYLIDIDFELEKYKTPKLILQPLIENAIFHGLNKKSGRGLIKVLARRGGNSVIFRVEDNGAGMNPEELESLNKKINAPMLQCTADSHGYAVRNVNQRIKLSCGVKYGIFYESKKDLGTRVYITIPVIGG